MFFNVFSVKVEQVPDESGQVVSLLRYAVNCSMKNA